MTAPTPSLEQLQQVRHGRRADLLRKWAAGQKLAEQEMSEISDLLPLELLANPPPPRPGYLHEYVHYAALIGYDVRNIKRLVAVGRRGRMPCPLDEVAKLPDWWDAMRLAGELKQKCPQRVLDAAMKAQPAPAAAAVPAPVEEKSAPLEKSSTPPPPTAGTGTKVDFSEIQGSGLEAAVHELKIQLTANQQLLRKAMETGENEVVITRRQKNYETTLDLLGKTEKTLQALQEARKELAPVADFQRDLTTILTTLRGMKRKLAHNVCAKLETSLTPAQLAAVRDAIAAEGAREEVLLRNARHWRRAADGSVDV